MHRLVHQDSQIDVNPPPEVEQGATMLMVIYLPVDKLMDSIQISKPDCALSGAGTASSTVGVFKADTRETLSSMYVHMVQQLASASYFAALTQSNLKVT